MIRKILLALLALLIIGVIWNWSLVRYAGEQGIGQARIIWNARPASELMKDPGFPDSLKMRLRWIEEIRAYGIDSLGLKDTENYKTVYDQHGEEIMWVVMACEPFQLKPKMWDFPIIGTVPYKGYFDRAKAVAEGKELENQGFDVSVRNPGGWSTLGWFTDPILTGMLERSEGDLASLIIHEMVHATLWVKDSVDFNENLATFIGDTAAYLFLAQKYGVKSRAYMDYLHDDRDYYTYSNHMLRGAKSLDSLYGTLKETDPLTEKKERKRKLIQQIVSSLDTLKLYGTRSPSQRFKNHLPNNTYFMSFRHYQSKLNSFKSEMKEKFPGDLKGYLKYLAAKYPV